MDQLNDAAKAKEQDYVKQLKANGTFDFLRKDCLTDIESMVNGFLIAKINYQNFVFIYYIFVRLACL